VLNVIRSLLFAAFALFRTRSQSAIEILALRHQLGVLQRSAKRPQLTNVDRGLWVLLSRRWCRWKDALIIVKPATVIRWHRAGFRCYWAWRSRPKGGRPAIDSEVCALIRRMATANLWGAPRIHGELLKLGFQVSEATLSKHMPRWRTPPSQTWRTFLENHVRNLIFVDFFTVPTLLFNVLVVFVVLAHDRRRILSVNVTSSPSAEWTANQIVQAFPWETGPRYLLRDRDKIYGAIFRKRVGDLGIKEVVIAPRSPWQSPYVERVIGTLRRELLDHAIVLNEAHLRRLLRRFIAEYYHPCRTHLSLGKDSPDRRSIEPPELGEVVELPLVGGLHHRYASAGARCVARPARSMRVPERLRFVGRTLSALAGSSAATPSRSAWAAISFTGGTTLIPSRRRPAPSSGGTFATSGRSAEAWRHEPARIWSALAA
jgi:transposase InsO family protein